MRGLPRYWPPRYAARMATINQLATFLESFAPLRLAEDWDNVGLLMGDRQRTVERVMTCLTVTPPSAAEAIREGAELIVTHHPLPFRALKKLTTDTTAGRMLWELAAAGVAIYSPHTAFDSAAEGINQQLAASVGLEQIQPLVPIEEDADGLGAGRVGKIDCTVGELSKSLRSFLKIDQVRGVGEESDSLSKVAIACGSGGSFLHKAAAKGCDGFITGEMTFHDCLAAAAQNIAVLLTGHYASERFACENLATTLAGEFSGLKVWASRDETDPLSVL